MLSDVPRAEPSRRAGVTEIVGHQNSFVNCGELDANNERPQGLITGDRAGL
jgi:hypothetical protein